MAVGIWGITTGESTLTNYPAGNQTALDDAKTHAAISGGHVVADVGTDALSFGALAGTVGLTRYTSDGRTIVSKFRIGDDTDPTKLVKVDASGITTATTRVITMPNYDGTLPLPSGYGTTGQILKSLGAGVQPVFADVPGVSGSTRSIILGAYHFITPGSIQGVNNTWISSSFGAGSLTAVYMLLPIPPDFFSIVSWKIMWAASSGSDSAQQIYRVGLFKMAAGSTLSGSYTDGANGTDNAPGVANQLVITTCPNPAVTFAVGDQVMLRATRDGGADASLFASNFLGVIMTYST